MIISEINITKQLQNLEPHGFSKELKQILKKAGWQPLGMGVESVVAMHPAKAYVLKIFDHLSRYQDFVSFVQKHQQNPHLPRFSRYVRQVPGTEFLYVRMEKLQKVPVRDLLDKYFSYLLGMQAMAQAHEIDMLGSWTLSDMVQDKLLDWGYDLTDLLDHELNAAIYERAGGPPPHTWFEVLDDLGAFSHQIDIERWDMHDRNFMRRGSTLVIADPFY